MTSGESGEIINSVASEYFVNSDVSPRDPLLFQQEDESLYDWMKRKQQIGDIGAAAEEDGENQVWLPDHGSFEPRIGHGLICSQETKSIAMFYDTHRF